MADLQNFGVTTRSRARITVPRATITAQITDSDTGAVLQDFTGANAILFPEVLDTLTTEESDAFLNYIALWLVQKKAGMI
jgi:hypothetical protein